MHQYPIRGLICPAKLSSQVQAAAQIQEHCTIPSIPEPSQFSSPDLHVVSTESQNHSLSPNVESVVDTVADVEPSVQS